MPRHQHIAWIGVLIGLGALSAMDAAGSVDPASPSAPLEDLSGFGLVDLLDNVNALSSGQEPISYEIFFSIDRVSVGLPGRPAAVQAAPGAEEAHADVYYHPFTGPEHLLSLDEQMIGFLPGFFSDDLDAMGSAVYFSIDSTSMTNMNAGGTYSDDILVVGAGGFSVWADGVTLMGLSPGDDLDALILFNVLNPNVDPTFDRALFSLSPQSPSTFTAGLGGSISPADVLLTDFTGGFGVYVSSGTLGLRADDNIDALSTSPPPCTPAPEACGDGVDNDCDGFVDCDDPDCGSNPSCGTTAAPGDRTVPHLALALLPPAPNPFSGSTEIRLTMPNASNLDLSVFDVHGRSVRTLAHGTLAPGAHVYAWNGRDDRGRMISSGLYVIRMVAGDRVLHRRVVRLR